MSISTQWALIRMQFADPRAAYTWKLEQFKIITLTKGSCKNTFGYLEKWKALDYSIKLFQISVHSLLVIGY